MRTKTDFDVLINPNSNVCAKLALPSVWHMYSQGCYVHIQSSITCQVVAHGNHGLLNDFFHDCINQAGQHVLVSGTHFNICNAPLLTGFV